MTSTGREPPADARDVPEGKNAGKDADAPPAHPTPEAKADAGAREEKKKEEEEEEEEATTTSPPAAAAQATEKDEAKLVSTMVGTVADSSVTQAAADLAKLSASSEKEATAQEGGQGEKDAGVTLTKSGKVKRKSRELFRVNHNHKTVTEFEVGGSNFISMHNDRPPANPRIGVYADWAINYLEEAFAINNYPSKIEMEAYSKDLDLSFIRVRSWFQNQRSRSRRKRRVDEEWTEGAERKAVIQRLTYFAACAAACDKANIKQPAFRVERFDGMRMSAELIENLNADGSTAPKNADTVPPAVALRPMRSESGGAGGVDGGDGTGGSGGGGADGALSMPARPPPMTANAPMRTFHPAGARDALTPSQIQLQMAHHQQQQQLMQTHQAQMAMHMQAAAAAAAAAAQGGGMDPGHGGDAGIQFLDARSMAPTSAGNASTPSGVILAGLTARSGDAGDKSKATRGRGRPRGSKAQRRQATGTAADAAGAAAGRPGSASAAAGSRRSKTKGSKASRKRKTVAEAGNEETEMIGQDLNINLPLVPPPLGGSDIGFPASFGFEDDDPMGTRSNALAQFGPFSGGLPSGIDDTDGFSRAYNAAVAAVEVLQRHSGTPAQSQASLNQQVMQIAAMSYLNHMRQDNQANGLMGPPSGGIGAPSNAAAAAQIGAMHAGSAAGVHPHSTSAAGWPAFATSPGPLAPTDIEERHPHAHAIVSSPPLDDAADGPPKKRPRSGANVRSPTPTSGGGAAT